MDNAGGVMKRREAEGLETRRRETDEGLQKGKEEQ